MPLRELVLSVPCLIGRPCQRTLGWSLVFRAQDNSGVQEHFFCSHAHLPSRSICLVICVAFQQQSVAVSSYRIVACTKTMNNVFALLALFAAAVVGPVAPQSQQPRNRQTTHFRPYIRSVSISQLPSEGGRVIEWVTKRRKQTALVGVSKRLIETCHST